VDGVRPGGVAVIRAARAAGDYQQAHELVRHEIEAVERERGADAPELAVLLNELGMIGKYRGIFGEAEQAYRRALAIYASHGDTSSANVAALLHNLAGLAHARGDAAAAEPLARRGILIREALTTDPLALAQDRAAFAAILIDLGRLAEADQVLRQILRIYEEVYGPVHYEVAVSLHNLGSLRFREGSWREAADLLRRALEVKVQVLARDNPDLAITLHNLACCELKLGKTDRARDHLLQAIKLLESTVAPSHPTLVSCRTKLGAVELGYTTST
jgi:tetratricopeptide (TPR) repeat protein